MTPRLATVLTSALLLATVTVAQPPGRRGGPPRPPGPPGGPGAGLERIVDDLKLSEAKRDEALAAIRGHQADVRRLTELARSDLLLNTKELLTSDEFRSFRRAIEPPAGGPGGRGGGGLGADAMIERILSFDKNQDGKITKDELPERMQNLVTKGDTNQDGALDRDEIKKLAADLPRDDEPIAGGRRGPGPKGRGGPPGVAAPRQAVRRRLSSTRPLPT